MERVKTLEQRDYIWDQTLSILEKVMAGERVPQLEPDDEVPCAYAPDIFFPEKQGSQQYVAEARAICYQCPVLEKCIATTALSPVVEHGVVAGMTLTDRAKARRVAKAALKQETPSVESTEVA